MGWKVEGEGKRGELDRWAMSRPMLLMFARGWTWSGAPKAEESD